jgi:hypothetical protein
MRGSTYDVYVDTRVSQNGPHERSYSSTQRMTCGDDLVSGIGFQSTDYIRLDSNLHVQQCVPESLMDLAAVICVGSATQRRFDPGEIEISLELLDICRSLNRNNDQLIRIIQCNETTSIGASPGVLLISMSIA